MKANPVHPFSLAALALALSLVTACSQRQPIIPPQPVPAPKPAAQPVVRLAPLPSAAIAWNDAAITPGTWKWRMEGSRSVARFGGDLLVLSCNRETATVTMLRPGVAEAHVPVTILTSSMSRTASAMPVTGVHPAIGLTLPARDQLLDAMAFSRGRFAVEVAGLPTLFVPSWPEVSRVIEDCR